MMLARGRRANLDAMSLLATPLSTRPVAAALARRAILTIGQSVLERRNAQRRDARRRRAWQSFVAGAVIAAVASRTTRTLGRR